MSLEKKINPFKVTIIMATYNRAHLISESINSIINQTFINWELIIVDDGGSDATKEVLSPYLENDNRIKYVTRPTAYKKGLPGCRNYGLSIASGDAIIFFDDDDIIHPDNLKICTSVLDSEKVDYCSYHKKPFEGAFNTDIFDFNDDYLLTLNDKGTLEAIITGAYPLASCTVLWKTECFKNNLFNENLQYAEEWELYQRILSTNIKGVRVDKVLYYNRKHPNSNTGEFWNANPIRVNSKKEAIRLVVDNLVVKNVLSTNLFNHLVGLAIYYRDKKLLNYITEKRKISYSKKVYLQFRYRLFPVWKVYKRIIKK